MARISDDHRVLFAALLVALAVASTAQAQGTGGLATGGQGLYRDNIVWFNWGAPGAAVGAGASVTNTIPVAGQILRVTCQIPVSNAGLRVFANDVRGLGALYRQPPRTGMDTGLANVVGGGVTQVSFSLTCSATFGPTGTAADPPFAMDGLVYADSEQNANASEFEQATPTGPGAATAIWRIIDRYRPPACLQSTSATLSATNTLRLAGGATFCNPPAGSTTEGQGPMAVAFLQGASSMSVQMQGNQRSAIALGVFVNTGDQGDAPASYGAAQHLAQSIWSGGTVTGTAASPQALNDPAFSLATLSIATPIRFGATVDTEINLPGNATATADDEDGLDDEDAFSGPVTIFGGVLSDIPCTGTGAAVRGFVDWNQDGDFNDAGEASAPATCSAGGTVDLSWSPPVMLPGPTFLRLRIANDAAEVASPTGVASVGEVEDHQVTSVPARLMLTKTTQQIAGGPFGFALTNTTQATGTVTTAAAGTATQVDGDTTTGTPEAYIVSTLGSSITIDESGLPAGWVIDGATTCTGPGGSTVGSLSGSTYTIPGAAVVSGATFTCSFVNQPIPDLAITKSSTPNPYVSGTPFTYTILVSNLGPGSATGASVSDPLPAPLAAFGWTCTPNSIDATCGTPSGTGPSVNTLVNLPAGGSVTILVTGTLPPGTSGVLTNTATVAPPAGITDPVPSNNTATDVNPADNVADLRISKASTPNPYVPGQPLTYTVVVTNAGPSDALGARVRDQLPAAFASFAWTCDAGPGATCLTASGVGDVDALVDLSVGTTATFTSSGPVAPSYTSTATNTATITPPPTVTDPVPGNNTATSQNPPGPIVDLAITKAQTPDLYVPAQPLSYTLLVQNLGPSDASNARVQDVLPGVLINATWSCAASGAGAVCGTPNGVNVVDALVTLPVGTTATFTIDATVLPSATGLLINAATVTAPVDVTDPVPGNNTSTATSGGAPQADLAVVKTASIDPYVPGAPLSFTIVVSNAGPSDAPNARVQDLVPAALSGLMWTCTPSAGAAACGALSGMSLVDVLVTLPVGGAVTFTVSGTVPPDTTGTLRNTATVTPPIGVNDPQPANNTSTVVSTPAPMADLHATKTSAPTPYIPGSPITYTLVYSNTGPSDVFGAHVQDQMPPVLTNVAWACTASGGTCPTASGTGNLDALVDIGVGGSVTFTITADVPSGTTGTLLNAATIVPPAGVVDPTPNDNSAVDANPVASPGGPADLQITQEFPGVAPPNGLLTFRLRSRNLGSNTALNPYVTGMIPPGTTFVSVTPSAGGTCNVPGNPPAPDPVTGYPTAGAAGASSAYASHRQGGVALRDLSAPAATEPLTCTWPGLMKPGDSHYMEFTVRVAPGTPTGQILWSCWWTWSQTEDPYHANNVVDAYLFVDDGMSAVGDLSVQAAAQSEGVVGTTLPTRVGVPVPMRFWATNHGPAATRGQYALILDTPNTIEIVDVQLAQGWVSPSGPSSAVWDTGPVAPGQTVALDLTVRPLTPSAVELFAQRITGSPGDPNASNERATIVLDGYAPGFAGRWVAVGNVDGAGAGEILTGAGQGETPQVRVFTGTGADTGVRFFAYERPFAGGVQIASCDVNGDGIAELITAPGPGRAPTIRVLSLVGGVVSELIAFDAFESGFLGGASVACADLDADGKAEVVIGAGPGRAPDVQVYTVGLSSIVPRASFLAYEAGFLGGVRVAAGVYPGRAGWLDAFGIATTPGAGRAPELRMWTPTGAPVAQVVVSSATRGVLPTLGDVNGDGQLDLLLAPDDGRPELVRIFAVDTGEVLGDVPGGLPAFPVGIRTAVGVLDGGAGQPEIVIGNGPGGHPRVRVVFWPPAGPVQRLEILPLEIP